MGRAEVGAQGAEGGEHGMNSIVRRFCVEENGPSATEYAIMLALIVLVAAAAIQGVGARIINIYQNIDGAIPNG